MTEHDGGSIPTPTPEQRLSGRIRAAVVSFSKGQVWAGNRMVWECGHMHTADDKHTAEFYAIQCADARLRNWQGHLSNG